MSFKKFNPEANEPSKKLEANKINRRDFLKILGASSSLAIGGCRPNSPEKLIPYVIQPDEIIPGVPVLYASTCGESHDECGVLLRVREGRVIMVEGNPNHPISKGGVSPDVISSLQAHYSPDRIREPMKRDSKVGNFVAISWEEALSIAAEGITSAPGGLTMLTGEHTASLAKLINALEENEKVSHLAWRPLSDAAQEVAIEEVYGKDVHISYDIGAADVIVSFGAGFLDTWGHSTRNARAWAENRGDVEDLSYVVQFEPRLSLTGANADEWFACRPGSELRIIAALEKSMSRNSFSLKKLLDGTGIDVEVIFTLGKLLKSASNPLILAGGSATTGERGVDVFKGVFALNEKIGALGRTFYPWKDTRKNVLKSECGKLHDLLLSLYSKNSAPALLISGVNPVYSLPKSSKVQQSLAKAPIIISVSSHMDETTEMADLILPLSTQFESWGDSEPFPNFYNLSQPGMQPLYSTQSLGDTLLSLAELSSWNTYTNAKTFADYIEENWKAIVPDKQSWMKAVQRGGFWKKFSGVKSLPLAEKASSIIVKPKPINPKKVDTLFIIAFSTGLRGDGTPANRPWIQEIPDPLSGIVWGSWMEIHPDTAASKGIEQGHVVRVVTEYGGIEVPALITKNIFPNVIAIPLGGGHSAYGRFANGVGANPVDLLTISKDVGISYVSEVRDIKPVNWKEELVQVQQFDDQLGRDLIVVKDAESSASDGHYADHGKDGDSHHSASKQMYHQMEHLGYRWGMNVDLASCTGCSACVIACYAENNIAVVGKKLVSEGREMAWLRIDRYRTNETSSPVAGFQPMMCQHCANAGCEPVCPVYATYHNEEGLNRMVYNRCVGTRYCSNNCSYKVRRFNWFNYKWQKPLNWQLNPDVSVREVGVMEKCSFCVQRIRLAKNTAKNEGREVLDGEILTACESVCPTNAIAFGNLNDKDSKVFRLSRDKRSYKVLDHHINTQPSVSYLEKVRNKKLDKKTHN